MKTRNRWLIQIVNMMDTKISFLFFSFFEIHSMKIKNWISLIEIKNRRFIHSDTKIFFLSIFFSILVPLLVVELFDAESNSGWKLHGFDIPVSITSALT